MTKTRYTKASLIADVKKEAIALRQNATEMELLALENRTFNPKSYYDCIYGQMTGDCRSQRAAELVFSCCKRYIDFSNDYISLSTLGDVKKHINGAKIKGVETPKDLRVHRKSCIRYFSSLEGYILMPFAKNDNLIAFLKGKTETLDL
jgi:hypothetical protein